MVEVWLRGPVAGVPPLLQPVAHALLQAGEEIDELMKIFPETLLWQKPVGVASVGFHLQHIHGVLDRLFTYANSESLLPAQLDALKAEGVPKDSISKNDLVKNVMDKIVATVNLLMHIDEATLMNPREVGRQKLPSTSHGLLFHSAEHTMRHVGQLHVTVKVLLASYQHHSL